MNNVEAPAKKSRCQHIGKTGQRCHADPQTGKEWCFFHDPEQKKKQAEARKQGGEARSRQAEPEIKLPTDLPVLPLEEFSDVLNLLEQTINHLLQGEMDVPAARAIGYLAGLQQRAIKANAQPMVIRLADTINRFRRGEMDLRTAKTIGHLTSLMLNALKQQAQQQRMMEATRSLEPMRLAEAARLQNPIHGSTQRLAAPEISAEAPDDLKPNPAVLHGQHEHSRSSHVILNAV